jgi:cofilin
MDSFTVSEDAIQHFNDMRMKRTHRYVILKVEGSQAVLESVGAREATFDAFKEAMPKNEPRFAVYDLEFKKEDGRSESKVVFIMYSPDECTSIQLRFAYS